jgi:hypothetical protein
MTLAPSAGSDMGFIYVFGPCWSCGQGFQFNPNKVPSLEIDGTRRPICADCMALANTAREQQGKPPHQILPGAYEPEEAGHVG